MAETDFLAQYHLTGSDEPADSATAQSIESCLRYLQTQAERVGMPMTAHLISAAALAALDEYVSTRGRTIN